MKVYRRFPCAGGFRRGFRGFRGREARSRGTKIREVAVENAFWEGVGIVVGLEVDAEKGQVKAAAPYFGPGASYAR